MNLLIIIIIIKPLMWNEKLREIVTDRRACHKRVMEGNKEESFLLFLRQLLLAHKRSAI